MLGRKNGLHRATTIINNKKRNSLREGEWAAAAAGVSGDLEYCVPCIFHDIFRAFIRAFVHSP